MGWHPSPWSSPGMNTGVGSHTRGLPWWLSGNDPAYNAGDLGSIPGSRRSPGVGHGDPL